MNQQTVNSAREGAKKLSKEQQEFVDDLKHSLRQVEQHLNGEIELKSADQLLNEL